MRKLHQDNTQRRLLPQMAIEELETEAIDFLQERCGQSGHIGVGFSGGKDSTVIMELMRRSGLTFDAFYHATQIDPPEIVRFIRTHHPGVRFLYPQHKFYAKIIVHAPPLPSARWCCGVLKHDSKQTKKYNPLVLGIRSEESFNRKNYHRWESRPRQTAVYPILDWTMADVWEYIEFRNLPYCSLYDEGFDRLGCVPCCFKSPGMHKMSQRRWPGIYRAFEKSVARWFYAKWWTGHGMRHDSPEKFLIDWYNHKAHWYGDGLTYWTWRNTQLRQMENYLERMGNEKRNKIRN
jgi:phosphoadenosine phosphosulfate reductase